MGVIYLLNAKTPKIALDHFSQAVKIDPNYVEAYYGRALCYQAINDKRNAVLDFQTALALNPSYEPAKEGLKKLGAL